LQKKFDEVKAENLGLKKENEKLKKDLEIALLEKEKSSKTNTVFGINILLSNISGDAKRIGIQEAAYWATF